MYVDIVRKAIEVGGTATGEHGIGQGKQEFLVEEQGEGAVEVMPLYQAGARPQRYTESGEMFPETATGKRLRTVMGE